MDADVVFKFRNLVEILLSSSRKLGDKAVLHVPYKFLHFNSHEDAEKFMDDLLHKNEYWKNQGFNFRPVAWCGLGFTLIPRQAITFRFDDDMTFREDRYFGFEIWKRGFSIYELINEDLAFDVNIGHSSNLYFSMSLKSYLRGIRKKVAMDVYNIFDPFFPRFIKNFIIKDIRILYHAFYTVLAILSILIDMPVLLWVSFALILLYILRQFKKSRNPIKVLEAYVKFYIYSIILVALLIPTYLKHKREYQAIYSYLSIIEDYEKV